MLKKIESRTIASIETIALEYVMEKPPQGGYTGHFSLSILAYVVANNRPHLCPLLGKTGMEWEPAAHR